MKMTQSASRFHALHCAVLSMVLVAQALAQTPDDLKAARKLRAEGAYLELKGKMEAAADKFEESLAYVQDAAVLATVKRLRGQGGADTGEEAVSVEGSASPLCPGPFEVKVNRAPDGKPASGVPVQLAGRFANTTPDGVAVFDGVPAGTHPLRLRVPGFNVQEMPVVLPPGRREPIRQTLIPEQRVATLAGKVLLADLRMPVAGARLRFEPVKVAAAQQGPVEFLTDWEGGFTVLQLPVGQYEVLIRAAGCRELNTSLTLSNDGKPLEFALERMLEPARLTVTVVNGVSAAPVANAEVVLAEAWPDGEVARTKTDAGGVARFDSLRLAQINWRDKEGKCGASRRNITVHVEAEGHAPATDPVALGADARAEVRLFPIREVEEQEPNDTIGNPQEIDIGAVVKFTLPKNSDHDWFKFRLPYAGHLEIEVGPDNPLQTYVWLHNANGDVIAQSGAYEKTSNKIGIHVPAGEYRLHIAEWDNNAASPELLHLRLAYHPVPDPLAPNDTLAEARLLRVNEECRGFQHPVGDVDHYRFQVSRPCGVKLSLAAAPFQRHLRMCDAKGVERGAVGSYGDPAAVFAYLEPGPYTVAITEWDRNACSLSPYSMRLEVIEDDLVDDTPGSATAIPSWGRPLAINSLAGISIYPLRDVDYYMIAIPGPGVLRVHATSAIQSHLRILSAGGKILGAAGAYEGKILGTEYHANLAEVVYVEVREWDDNHAAPSPYVIWNTFLAADELDTMGRNDTPDAATPFVPGDSLRGSILPLRDVDVYSFHVDRPGWFDVTPKSPIQMHFRVLDAKRNIKGQWGFYENRGAPFSLPLVPGDHFLEVREWDDNAWSEYPYEVQTAYRRADPDEPAKLAESAPLPLDLNVVRTFKIEHVGDRDRFLANLPAAGSYELSTEGPIQRHVVVRDVLTAKELFRFGKYEKELHRQSFEVKGPTRIEVEVTEWDNNAFSMDNSTLLLAEPGKKIVAERLVATVDRTDPTRVVFKRSAYPPYVRAVKASLDADGDGRPDLDLPAEGEVEFRYKQQGVYSAQAFLEGADGIRGSALAWVEAVGYHERKGVHLLVNSPLPDATVETSTPLRAFAISYSGARVNRIEAAVDGAPVGSTHSAPYEIPVPWDNFGPGLHTLKVTATDTKGTSKSVERKFRVSEFFELFPREGAQVTGQNVPISWRGRTFGPTAVRYRKAGEKEWAKTVQGPTGRARRMVLADLEPGVAYEFQPVGAEEGPIRTLTRVKGLAFGKSTYAASIRRDYDQRVGVSVRNHGEKPLTVKLECGQPPAESLLLAGFVGEGSEGAPFELAPGEEREFLLGISAQDCVSPRVSFPVRISSQTAEASDEALVDLEVKLPNVVLEWEEKGELPGSIGKVMVLKNKGDTLTDLVVGSNSTDLGVRPTIAHGMLPAGQSVEFTVVPRLYEGFTAVEGTLEAKAVNKATETVQRIALKEGEAIHAVELGPRASDPEEHEVQRERALAGAYMNPAAVDWSQRTQPQDSNGDGKIDRWVVDIPYESTRWIGFDTDGDGEVDLAQADIGPDGRVDYSAMKSAKGWEESNLVNSTLEMGFSLPYARSAYEKHDADIVFNGKVVGNLKDTIPDGNYAFPVPPSAFLFNEDGSPAPNEVRIQSKHLRGGHYVVTSNFKLKMNLTGTRVYTAAKTQKDAEAAVMATPGLVLDAPDLSVSSAEMQVQGTPKSGSPLTVRVPIRNLGSGSARKVTAALVFAAGGQDVELARTAYAEIPPNGQILAEFTAPAPTGDVVLKVLLDPDKRSSDCDDSNNEARAAFKAEGDAVKPTLVVAAPAEGAALENPVVAILAEADDNEGIARVDVRIDQGLWTPLAKSAKGFEGKALLQPGPRRVFVRALDTSGNVEEKSVNLQITAAAPSADILEPQQNAEINSAATTVAVTCDANTQRVAARVNGGPWQQGKLDGPNGSIPVTLTFGDALIEVMAVNKQGIRGVASRNVRCTRQLTEEEAQKTTRTAPPAQKPAPVDVQGFGPVDPTAEDTPVATDATPAAAGNPEVGAAPGTGEAAAAPADNGAEVADVPDAEDEDGSYGAEPPEEEPDPDVLAELDAEEAALEAEGEDDLDPEEWLRDPETDAEENPEFALEPDEDPDYEMPDMESWDEMPQPDTPEAPEEASPQGPGSGFGPLPPTGDAGGYVGVQQKQSDWYCTNRPEIGVKFQMPDWLKKLNVPKPGSKEFEEMFNKRLAALKAKGMDTSQLEKMRSILQNRCKRLDSPAELPDFLQALGFQFGYKAKPNPSELAEWREKMANATDAFMLRLLHSNDPMLIAQGLEARMGALGQFDTAAQESAEAALETVKATQKVTEEVAMAVPYLNVAMSAHALWSGENLSGEKLGKLETAFHLLTLAGPAYQLFKNPSLRQAAASIGNKAMWMGEKTIGRLAAKLGLTPDRVKAMMKATSDALGKARIQAGEKLLGKTWAEGQRFMNSPAGREAAARAARDAKQAESLLHRIAQARAAGDKVKYRELIGKLQGNKTAQGLLNSPKYSNTFRNALDKTHRAMGRLADKGTIRQYMQTDTARKEIEALAKKLGVKPSEIVVRAQNISGNTKTLRNLKPGEMLKYGADRDVVFQYCLKGKDGAWRSVKDVHHRAIQNIYNRNLKAVTGRSAHSMDHVVTSRWNPEAYNSGLNPNTDAGRKAIGDIISGKAAGSLQRPSDIRDTIIHKGKEWMESGRKWAERGAREGKDVYMRIGNQKMKEGMRQMSKEYNRQVAQFLQAKGLDASRALPPRLKQGLDIFKKVEQGMPVEQAREMLKALTPKGGIPVTPESIAEDLGYFVEFINRWGLKATP